VPEAGGNYVGCSRRASKNLQAEERVCGPQEQANGSAQQTANAHVVSIFETLLVHLREVGAVLGPPEVETELVFPGRSTLVKAIQGPMHRTFRRRDGYRKPPSATCARSETS
jgi:hypothetical protein